METKNTVCVRVCVCVCACVCVCVRVCVRVCEGEWYIVQLLYCTFMAEVAFECQANLHNTI